jgi:rubredoxin
MQARKFECLVCGHIHDEAHAGRWEELPEDWVCPECGASKRDFQEAQCELS